MNNFTSFLFIKVQAYKLSVEKSDTIIIKEILSGKKESFNLLYSKYSRYYMLTCLRYFKNREEAKDFVQESFITIFKSLHQFDAKKAQFSTWSNRVVVNVCLQHIRKKNIVQVSDDIIDIGQNLKVNPTAIDHLNLNDLTKLILNLPDGYRTVFNMYIIDGFTHKEIAEKLGVSISTSKSQLMKARKMLQLFLKKTENPLREQYAYGG